MTRWTPDTCGCEIEYDENIQHVLSVIKCAKHAGHDGQAHLDEVLKHNRQKNAVLNDIVASGVDSRRIHVFYDPVAQVDADPVTIKSLDGDVHLDEIALTAKFGANKIRVI